MSKLTGKLGKEKLRKALDFDPHPNVIFGVLVDTSVTDSGIIKPEQAKDKTPVIEIVAIGSNVEKQFDGFIRKGARCYVALPYIQYAEINGVDFIVMFPDAILGVKTQYQENSNILQSVTAEA